MCGIAGIIKFGEEVRSEELQMMTDRLVHRGPDGSGHWINSNKHVGFGHRRLSIIDLSEAASQPMHYSQGRYTITFNGEIYNYIEIKDLLVSKGYQFKTYSDTEVLLALYDFEKEEGLRRIDGMFAFAIWDQQEGVLFCARDRFGEKPFYYHHSKDKLVFASEMKAIFSLGVNQTKSNRHIYNYLLYGIVEDPYNPSSTFFSEISQLDSASYMKIKSDGSMEKKKYWDISPEINYDITEEEAVKEFRTLFSQSVNYRLRSDVPVGSSLSGGLDSSSIVMEINRIKAQGQTQKTFSARFKDFSKDEGIYMEAVINKASVDPYFVYPTMESVFKNLKKIMYHQELPFGSTSIAAQYEVMGLAADNGIKVLLDGQGADETLAGYTLYWNTYLEQLFYSDMPLFDKVRKDLEQLHGYKYPGPGKRGAIKRKFPRFYEKASSWSRKQKSPTSNYFMGIHPDLVRQFSGDPNPFTDRDSLKQHLYYSTFKSGLNELLRYADRNSMAHSIEVRLPFLSHKLVEFIFSLPETLLIKDGWTKYVLRKSVEPILPQEITWRKDKIGYEPPQSEWFKSGQFMEMLDAATGNLLKEKIIIRADHKIDWSYLMVDMHNEVFK